MKKQKTSKWMKHVHDSYREPQADHAIAVCEAILKELFSIPPRSEIQLRLSRRRQNAESHHLQFKRQCCGEWDVRIGEGYRVQHFSGDRLLCQFFPNALIGDRHYLYLTCWYRKAK